MNHKQLMAKALALAEKGRPRKNPYVGALVVKKGKIIGEGFHLSDGKPHAEFIAINLAKGNLKKAILFCTLEPCHGTWEGKINSPCTTTIIKSGIKKVIIASLDPNPKVNGRGVKALQENGIDVEIGLLSKKEKYLNRKYRKRCLKHKPYVHLKIAQTLDGRIAKNYNKPCTITGLEVQKVVHTLRSQYEAVLVGLGTLLADNPLLSVRDAHGDNPIRVLLDSKLQIPLYCNLCDIKTAPTIIYHNSCVSSSKVDSLNGYGIQTQSLTTQTNGELSLEELTADLYKKGISSILVEGGSRVASSFLKHRLVDEVSWFISPGFGGDGVTSLHSTSYLWDYPQLKKTEFKTVGEDFYIQGLTEEGLECLQD